MNWRWTSLFCHCILERFEVLPVNFISFFVLKMASFMSCHIHSDFDFCSCHYEKYIRWNWIMYYIMYYVLNQNAGFILHVDYLSLWSLQKEHPYLVTNCISVVTSHKSRDSDEHTKHWTKEKKLDHLFLIQYFLLPHPFCTHPILLGNSRETVSVCCNCVFICCGGNSLSSYTVDTEDSRQQIAQCVQLIQT